MYTIIDRIETEHTVELYLASDDIDLSKDPSQYDLIAYADLSTAENLQIGDYIDGKYLRKYVFRNF